MAQPPPSRILLVRTDRMGDLLMSLPVASAIRAALPAAEVTLLIREELRPLLEGHPDVHRLLSWEPAGSQGPLSSFRLARRLRPFRFDAAVVLNPAKVFHLACFLAGIPVRIGYRRKWGFLLSRSIPDTKHLRSLHETEYNLELARELGIPAARAALTLPERPEARAQAVQLLESHGVRPGQARLVAVHPWTSNPAKGWPVESFLEASRNFSGQGKTVLWIGQGEGPQRLALEEAPPLTPAARPALAEAPPRASAQRPRPDSGRVVDLCGKTPLRVLPELLRLCSVLLTNDSGPAHVAAAVGTPTIVVAPREHERQMRRWRPLGDAHRVLLSPTVAEVLAAFRPSP